MHEESPEKNVTEVQSENTIEASYQKYVKAGGIINETDYQDALDKARANTLNKSDPSVKASIRQAVSLLEEETGVTNPDKDKYLNYTDLENITEPLDPKVALYAVLRTDKRPKIDADKLQHPHVSMDDKTLFEEVLKMLE